MVMLGSVLGCLVGAPFCCLLRWLLLGLAGSRTVRPRSPDCSAAQGSRALLLGLFCCLCFATCVIYLAEIKFPGRGGVEEHRWGWKGWVVWCKRACKVH